MEINTEIRALPGQAEHRLSESRQGRWLYELEQALMLRTPHKDAGAERPPERAPEQAPADGAAAQPVAAVAAVPPALVAGGAPQPPQSTAAVAGPAVAAAPRAGEGAAMAAVGVKAAATGGDAAGGDAAVAGATLPLMAQPVALVSPALSLAAYGAAAAVAVKGASTSGEAGGTHTAQAAAALTALGLGGAAPLTDAPALPQSQPAGSDETAEASETPAAAEAEQAPVDEYASRLLHLYHGAGGVQAWVRDAALDAAQSVLLARGMAQEISSAGGRLSALTINGKKILADGAGHTVNSKGAV
jgi:hypothetical protein